MEHATVTFLRCPACAAALHSADSTDMDGRHVERLVCSNTHVFDVRDNIADLIYPPELLEIDLEFKAKYDSSAQSYDTGLQWLFASFYEHENDVRQALVDSLHLCAGARVLEVSSGTGKDSEHIVRQIGLEGTLFATEISAPMLRRAQQRLQGCEASVEYLLCNAAYLPFPDRVFDAVFHFGGLNQFGEVAKSLDEMTRVTKLGGRVVVGDESIAPWLRDTEFGKILMHANPLYKHEPPMQSLPISARDVTLKWILGNAFYVISYEVGDKPPPVDLDLPIPGVRGGTLRSRYASRTSP